MTLYCRYCGRVAHRCLCDKADSRLHQFFARKQHVTKAYYPDWMTTPYKCGVPPQIKRKLRYDLRKNYRTFYAALSASYGDQCANCGIASEDDKLVLDHVLSIAKGGTSSLDNLQILCAVCNQIKGKLCIDCRSDTI